MSIETPRPPTADLAGLGGSLREWLAEAIVQGTAARGCDGTLRLTRSWIEELQGCPARMEANLRRAGVHCDCAMARTVLGRTDVRPRCARPRE